MNQELEAQAERFERIALELEQAAAHARTAAGHFRQGEVPRGCAHAFALEGHLVNARAELAAAAVKHSEKSRLQPPAD
ncbi:MAG: hypothetical protein ACAI44_39005 [Candidatus Sericytochromatia bacterium]